MCEYVYQDGRKYKPSNEFGKSGFNKLPKTTQTVILDLIGQKRTFRSIAEQCGINYSTLKSWRTIGFRVI